MYIVTNSNCAAFNKSVEVAQGLTTFFEFSVLGVERGVGNRGGNNGTSKITGTCGPGCGTACLFGSKELNRQEILLTGLAAGM
jgi:hypothetical protein